MAPRYKRRSTVRRAEHITVRLSELHDPDLVEFWRSQPDRFGGQVVKQAIRTYLASAGDQQPATHSDIEELARMIAEQGEMIASLARQVEALRASGLSVAPTPGASNNGKPQLTAEEQSERIKRVVKRQW